jgi:hypothetical protein
MDGQQVRHSFETEMENVTLAVLPAVSRAVTVTVKMPGCALPEMSPVVALMLIWQQIPVIDQV